MGVHQLGHMHADILFGWGATTLKDATCCTIWKTIGCMELWEVNTYQMYIIIQKYKSKHEFYSSKQWLTGITDRWENVKFRQMKESAQISIIEIHKRVDDILTKL